MKKINGIALTEKGVLKNAVRTAIKDKDTAVLEGVLAELGFEYVADKNAFVLTRVDEKGSNVYTVLTMTVSTKHPNELAERKSKPKASTEKDIEIE